MLLTPVATTVMVSSRCSAASLFSEASAATGIANNALASKEGRRPMCSRMAAYPSRLSFEIPSARNAVILVVKKRLTNPIIPPCNAGKFIDAFS